MTLIHFMNLWKFLSGCCSDTLQAGQHFPRSHRTQSLGALEFNIYSLLSETRSPSEPKVETCTKNLLPAATPPVFGGMCPPATLGHSQDPRGNRFCWRADVQGLERGSQCVDCYSPEEFDFLYLYIKASVFPRPTLWHSTGTKEPNGGILGKRSWLLASKEGDTICDVPVFSLGIEHFPAPGSSVRLPSDFEGLLLSSPSVRLLQWASLSNSTTVPPARSTLWQKVITGVNAPFFVPNRQSHFI